MYCLWNELTVSKLRAISHVKSNTSNPSILLISWVGWVALSTDLQKDSTTAWTSRRCRRRPGRRPATATLGACWKHWTLVVAANGADVGDALGWLGGSVDQLAKGQHDRLNKSAMPSQTRTETSWDTTTLGACWKHWTLVVAAHGADVGDALGALVGCALGRLDLRKEPWSSLRLELTLVEN